MANQPRRQQQFRFWFPHWNQTAAPQPPPSTMQPSSPSPLKVSTPASLPTQSNSASPSDTEPHFTSGTGSRATLVSPPPSPGSPSSPSPSPSRKSDQSPERRRQQQQQRSSSTRRLSQPSSPSPPRSRKEYTTLVISSSSSLSNGASQTQPTLTQEASENISSLQKENNETQSLNPQLASQTQESISSRHLESESIPITRTIRDETPLTQVKIGQVQEKITTYAEPTANTHPAEISKLKENPDRDVETQESRKKSMLLQVEEESEIVVERQHTLVEEKPELVSEESTMEIEITKEINPIKQNPERKAEAIQGDQPKVDSESDEPTTTYISSEKSNNKLELNTSVVQPDRMQAQVQPETQVEEESEIVVEHQHTLVEEKPELVSEESTMEIEITKEINPIKQNPERKAEAIQGDQPKVDSESDEPTTTYISSEKSNNKLELNTSVVQPDRMQAQVQPETTDSIELENMNGLSGKEQTNLMPDVPQVSPTIAGVNFHKEINGDSNWDEKMNNEGSGDDGNEHTRRIIHLAGKHHGASMYIGCDELNTSIPDPAGAGFTGSLLLYKQKEESKDNNATRKEESQVNSHVPSGTNINCSVQSINNSILHESSCSQGNPGVHLIFSRKPTETLDSIDVMDQFVL